DSPDLVRLSQALAQVGFEVYVPDLAEMKKQHLRPEESESVKAVFQWIGRKAGIACFSYGCGPALIAGMAPEINKDVRFMIAFGGYFDIREALEFVVTGPESPLAYAKWVYLAANTDLIRDENDRRVLREIADARLSSPAKDVVFEGSLSAEARALLDVFLA